MRATNEETGPNSLYAIAWRREIAPGTNDVGTVRAISVETGETLTPELRPSAGNNLFVFALP